MKILKNSNNNYYLNSSKLFFKKNFEKRLSFLKKKIFLFDEISNFLNNCVDNTKNIFIFCASNSVISKKIKNNKIYIKEIDEKYKLQHNKSITYKDEIYEEDVYNCDSIIIADIEHQTNQRQLAQIVKNYK